MPSVLSTSIGPHTDFSEFIMDVVENIREMGLQRIVILVQKGVSESVIDDATQRIAELLEGEKLDENKEDRFGMLSRTNTDRTP